MASHSQFISEEHILLFSFDSMHIVSIGTRKTGPPLVQNPMISFVFFHMGVDYLTTGVLVILASGRKTHIDSVLMTGA